MRSKYEELFELSEEKLKRAKNLMKELSKESDEKKKKMVEDQIETLLQESDQLSKIAESLGTTKH